MTATEIPPPTIRYLPRTHDQLIDLTRETRSANQLLESIGLKLYNAVFCMANEDKITDILNLTEEQFKIIMRDENISYELYGAIQEVKVCFLC